MTATNRPHIVFVITDQAYGALTFTPDQPGGGRSVTDRMGPDEKAGLLRLILVPGMAHCQGGDGLTSIDVLTLLMAWVEDGSAPDALIASRSDADAHRGRRHALHPWPATSRLRPNADPEVPSSWERGAPSMAEPKLYAD